MATKKRKIVLNFHIHYKIENGFKLSKIAYNQTDMILGLTIAHRARNYLQVQANLYNCEPLK